MDFGGLLQLDPEKRQALLMAAAGMLSSRGNTAQAFGQGLQQGLVGYNAALNSKDRRLEEEQQRKLRALQISQAEQGVQDQQNVRDVFSRNVNRGNLAPNDDEGNPMPYVDPSVNLQGLRAGLLGTGPAGISAFGAISQALAKESPFSKPDVKDFTPESVRAATAGGVFDPTKLEPRVKMESVNTGSATEWRNPYNPGGPIPHGLSPADMQRLPIERAQLGVSVAKARDEGVQGLPGVPGQGYVTGPAPGMAPSIQPRPQVPQGVPQAAPNALPGVAPTAISPKQQRDIAEKNAKEMPQDLASYQNAIANLEALKKSATEIRQHPGLAGISGGMSAFPNMPGSNAANAEALMTTLKSKTAFSTLQAMRDASKTGGALGSVSEKEIAYLENSLGAFANAQNVAQRRAELKKVETYADAAKARLNNAMRQRYGEGVFKQQDPLGIR
jgi:hypothetical protein